MNTVTKEQARKLRAIDTRHLDFPSLGPRRVTASWHHWLAFDELKGVYGWDEAELLALVAKEQALSGRHLAGCFEALIAYAYADCRHELSRVCDAPTWLPLPPDAETNGPPQAA